MHFTWKKQNLSELRKISHGCVVGKSQLWYKHSHVQRPYSISSLWCFLKSWPLRLSFYIKCRCPRMVLMFSLLMWDHIFLLRVLDIFFHHVLLKSEARHIYKFWVIVKQITQPLSLILLIFTAPFLHFSVSSGDNTLCFVITSGLIFLHLTTFSLLIIYAL